MQKITEVKTEFEDDSARSRIHVHHLAVIRLVKGVLVDALKVGAALQQERNRRGDDYESWVDENLRLTHDEADGYIRFHQESGIRPEQLSPAVDVKLPRLLDLLGQLTNAFGKGGVSPRSKGISGRRQPKTTVPSGDTSQVAPKPNVPAVEAVQAAAPTKNSTNGVTVKPKPAVQDRDGRQTELTAEQRNLLLRRSPKLLVRLRMGDISPEEALRLADQLPDRNLSPQPNRLQQRHQERKTIANFQNVPRRSED